MEAVTVTGGFAAQTLTLDDGIRCISILPGLLEVEFERPFLVTFDTVADSVDRRV